MAFDLQQLRQVLALAEHGSFVRAAATLHISQPALSRSIQNLERHLGTELFHRSASGVNPTQRGLLYIERARDLLRMADDLDREVRADAALQTGRVEVGGGPFPSESFLGPAALRFNERYPRISIAMITGDWDELAQRLRSRELDFFIAETSLLQREPELDVQVLPSQHHLYFYARAGHPLVTRGDFDVDEVFAWPFVTPARIPPRVLQPLLQTQRRAGARQANPRPFPSIRCTSVGLVRRIVLSSDTISASMLSCISRELESGEFVLLGTAPFLHLNYGIVSLHGRPMAQHTREFLDFVLEAERVASEDEARLVERFGPQRAKRVSRPRATRP